MARAEILSHNGARIVHIDLSHATALQVKEACDAGAPLIQGQPVKSVLCWVNTEGTMMSTEISDTLKNFTYKNKPYVKMTAITGLAGVQKVVLSAIIIFTKRDNLVVKPSREEALDFLASLSLNNGIYPGMPAGMGKNKPMDGDSARPQ